MSAATMSHASILPSITCSTCNQQIQLSMLGEHVCYSEDSALGQPPHATHQGLDRLDTHDQYAYAGSTDSTHAPSTYTSPPASANPLPTISEDEDRFDFGHDGTRDGNVGAGRDTRADQIQSDFSRHSPLSEHGSLPSRPLSPGGHMKSPSPLSSAGATSPRSPNFPLRIQRPPSPETVSQDSAFPTFPSKRPKSPPETLRLAPTPPIDQFIAPAPASPRFVDRMNTMSPGPFARSLSKFTGRKASQDKINKVAEKSGSSAGRMHISSPSITSVSGAKVDEFGNQLPSGPPPPRPPRPDDSKTPGEAGQMNGRTSFRPDSRDGAPDLGRASSIYPSTRSSSSSNFRDTIDFPDHLRQKAAALTQVQESPQAEEFDFGSLNDRPRSRSSSPSTAKGSGDTVPPLPTFNNTHVYDSTRHTPTESTSSTNSRAFFDDHRTESSRSSPPTSHNSTMSPQKLSVEDQNSRPLSTTSDYSLPSTTYQPPPRRSKNIGVDTTLANNDGYFEQLHPPQLSPNRHMIESPAPVISPLDTVQGQQDETQGENFRPPPRWDSNKAVSPHLELRPTLPQLEVPQQPQNQPPQTQHQPPQELPSQQQQQQQHPSKPRVKSKGKCRGCRQPIVGKSIKAADGLLSGRYHRECFVCKHCSTPFATMSFYIFRDHPYCAQHYHTLNNSLCHTCNTGIEGPYAETDSTKKFHTECFRCQDCGKPLTTDYYMVNGGFYCEQDASRAHQKLSPLNPGRFPERRLTRLGVI